MNSDLYVFLLRINLTANCNIKEINPLITGTDLGSAGIEKIILINVKVIVTMAVETVNANTSSSDALRY